MRKNGIAEIWKPFASAERTTTGGKELTLKEKNPTGGSTGGLGGVEPVVSDVQPVKENLMNKDWIKNLRI